MRMFALLVRFEKCLRSSLIEVHWRKIRACSSVLQWPQYVTIYLLAVYLQRVLLHTEFSVSRKASAFVLELDTLMGLMCTCARTAAHKRMMGRRVRQDGERVLGIWE